MSPERLHPAADGNRCRDTQPNIRQSSGNLVEDLGRGIRIEGAELDGGGARL